MEHVTSRVPDMYMDLEEELTTCTVGAGAGDLGDQRERDPEG